MKDHKRAIRRLVFNALYEADFCKEFTFSAIDKIYQRSIANRKKYIEENEYADYLIKTIIEEDKTINKYITEFAVKRTPHSTAIIDKNILRLGICEIFFGSKYNVSAMMGLEEAVELARTYGANNTASFVKGVLTDILKFNNIEISHKKYSTSKVIAGVIYTIYKNENYFLMVYDIFNKWRLPRAVVQNEIKKPEEYFLDRIKEVYKFLPTIEKKDIAHLDFFMHIPEIGNVKVYANVVLLKSDKMYEIETINLKSQKDMQWFKASQLQDLKIYPEVKKIIFEQEENLSKK